MGIKVASISNTEESEGFFSSLKGVIANLLLNPPEVTKLGNETMLDFGHALLEQKSAFTFPKAKNIKENKRGAGTLNAFFHEARAPSPRRTADRD